jgi:hypothetical protein
VGITRSSHFARAGAVAAAFVLVTWRERDELIRHMMMSRDALSSLGACRVMKGLRRAFLLQGCCLSWKPVTCCQGVAAGHVPVVPAWSSAGHVTVSVGSYCIATSMNGA